jgi:hypothetical protein
MREYLEEQNKTLKDVAQAFRVAITGKTTGAGLFETMALILSMKGPQGVIARLTEQARQQAEIYQQSIKAATEPLNQLGRRVRKALDLQPPDGKHNQPADKKDDDEQRGN